MNLHSPAALICAAFLAGAAAAQQPIDAVMASIREASGWPRLASHTQGIQLTGTASMAGTEASYLLILDSFGHYAQHIQGPISVTNAFDGERAWVDDMGGERRILQLGDREQSLLAGLILTGRWMAPDAPLNLSLAGDGPEGSQMLRFRLSDSELSGTIEVNRSTWRPRKWSYTVAGATHSYVFDGTIEFDGMKFPAEIDRESSHGMSLKITIEKAADAPTFFRSPYSPVLSPPSDVTFDKSVPAAIEVKKAPTGHLLVHTLVDGKDLGWFIFDSGAGSNCLDKRAAEALGAEQFGSIPAMGVGGPTKSTLVRSTNLTLGPVTIDKPLMVVMDFRFLDFPMGQQIAGIIGYGMLHRVVAAIDMETPAISLYDPAAYDASKVNWSKLLIDGRVACVEGEFEGHKGWFHLDTGAGASTVQLHAPAVERLKLLEGRTTIPTANGGVGGMTVAREGILKYFEIGGHRSEDVAATFASQAKGAFATPYTLGNIGGGLVRPFTLVMDYQHERIAFVERDRN